MPTFEVPTDDAVMQGFRSNRKAEGCTPATLRDYDQRLRTFRAWLGEHYSDLSLLRVQPKHIQAFLLWLAAEGRADWTRRSYYRALHAVYHWAVQEKLLDLSPLDTLQAPRVPKTYKPLLTDEQFKQLLAVCPQARFTGARAAAMLWILRLSGMRFMELARLGIVDLDADHEWIKVFGKGRKERYVEYPPQAARAVWHYSKFRRDALPNLWLTEERTPMSPAGVRIAINRVYRRAGVQVKDELHIFRRTWAVEKLRQGLAPKYLMELAGWQDEGTMLRYLQIVGSEEALEAAKRLRHR